MEREMETGEGKKWLGGRQRQKSNIREGEMKKHGNKLATNHDIKHR